MMMIKFTALLVVISEDCAWQWCKPAERWWEVDSIIISRCESIAEDETQFESSRPEQVTAAAAWWQA